MVNRIRALAAVVVLAAAAFVVGVALRRRGTDGPRLPQVEALFPGWTATAFHQPRLTVLPRGLRVEGGPEPSGILFRTTTDRNDLTRLLVRGIARSATLPGLRVRENGGPYVWQPLDERGGSLVLSRGSQVEILLYSDQPYAFELQEFRVERCPDCLTAAAFKELVAAEAHVEPTDRGLGLVRKLRNWTANAVVFALDQSLVDQTTIAVANEPPSQAYVEYFKSSRGGVSCGGIAVFFQKVLALFGVPSFTIGIGWNGTLLTHVTTIVVDGRGAARRYYIFDPTFAGTYVAGGTYVDALDLLRGAQARFETDPMSRRVLVPRPQIDAFLQENAEARSRAVCDKDSALPGTIECRGFVDNMAFNALAMGPLLRQRGIRSTDDFITTLMRHAVTAYGPSDIDPAAHQLFKQQVLELQAPSQTH